MEEIEKMSEETAQELISAFEDMNKDLDDLKSNISHFQKSVQIELAVKFVGYMEKYANATFLTRWYWLRKARKVNEAAKDIIQFDESYFKKKKE